MPPLPRPRSVFFKQRDNHFFPPASYVLSFVLTQVPAGCSAAVLAALLRCSVSRQQGGCIIVRHVRHYQTRVPARPRTPAQLPISTMETTCYSLTVYWVSSGGRHWRK